MIAEPLSADGPAQLPAESGASKVHRMLIMVFWGIGSFVTGMSLMVLARQFTHSNWIGLAAVLLLLAGILMAAYGALSPLLQIKRTRRNSLRQPVLPQMESRGMTSANPLEAKQSVTENKLLSLDSVAHKELQVHE